MDHDDHPMTQFRKTEEAAVELKEFAEQLWRSLPRGTKTAQRLIDRCNILHTAVVTRVPGSSFREDHDAVGAPQDLDDQEAEANGKQQGIRRTAPPSSGGNSGRPKGRKDPAGHHCKK